MSNTEAELRELVRGLEIQISAMGREIQELAELVHAMLTASAPLVLMTYEVTQHMDSRRRRFEVRDGYVVPVGERKDGAA